MQLLHAGLALAVVLMEAGTGAKFQEWQFRDWPCVGSLPSAAECTSLHTYCVLACDPHLAG
jgi:hypothetical protein